MMKWIAILTLIAILSFLHIQGSRTMLEGHLLHQQLFFIPIILASFWFHLRTGLVIAIIVSGIYISSMFYHMSSPSIQISVYTQISLYILIAALIGWLTDRLDKQQQQAIKDEKLNALAKLAAALSFEIREVVRGLEARYLSETSAPGQNNLPDVKEEIGKLKRLSDAFKQFDTPEKDNVVSYDLNKVVKKTQRKFHYRAKDSGISILTELDETGCPSMVLNDTIVKLFEALVDNALDASPRDSTIILRSTRKGSHCLLEVIDHGSGVREENVSQLFQPFFTTKAYGHGLSLAAGKKVMKDYEGDLLYERGKDGGSIFKLIVPRENINKNIDGLISERVSH